MSYNFQETEEIGMIRESIETLQKRDPTSR